VAGGQPVLDQGPHHTRRPDIVLFVNGLPLVLIELKNPADVNADIWKAFDQIQTYKAQIPTPSSTTRCWSSPTAARRAGLALGDAERFMQWRTIDGVTLDPLGEFNELETLVRGVLAPAMLLDYLRYFVLFEDDGTWSRRSPATTSSMPCARPSQVVTASRPGGTHKGGVVWHTQGSGKSITMTCFAARVMQEAADGEPDHRRHHRPQRPGRPAVRRVLAGAGSAARAAGAGPHPAGPARLLGNRPSGGIVFATIQKFMPGEDEDATRCCPTAHNIVVIADEAHRTQYGFEAKLKRPGAHGGDTSTHQRRQRGRAAASYRPRYQVGYAQHLRDALPNATFVAFTGTPVSARTATPAPCSATTSTSTTCSRPRKMAPRWPSTTSRAWPSWR
jgi:type I restriction enzyme R subunit